MEDILIDPLDDVPYLSKILIAGDGVHVSSGGPDKTGKFCGFIFNNITDMKLIWFTEPEFASADEAEERMRQIIYSAREFYQRELRLVGASLPLKEKPAR